MENQDGFESSLLLHEDHHKASKLIRIRKQGLKRHFKYDQLCRDISEYLPNRIYEKKGETITKTFVPLKV